MKKNIILTMVSLAALFIISGCESLDRSPDNQLSSGTFWKTETHARQAIVGVYAMFRDANICGEIFEEDAGGFIGTGYDRGFFNVVKGSYNSTTGVVTSKWSALYEGVARANSVIQNVSKMTDYLDQPTIDKYVGEAKFLRAYFYNMLLNYWGGVPIYDESIVVAEKFSEMKEPRSTAEQVREFILKDLDAAIAVLPEHGSWAASDYGRATKGAAQALKGKVLLYAKDYAGAATQFQSVISSGKYSLYKSYPDLFLPGGDASDEMIFAVQNIGGVGTDFGMPMCFYMGTRSTFGSCWDNFTASTRFVDSYENLDGTPFNWDDWFPGFNSDNKVKEEVFLLQNGSSYQNPERPAQVDKLLEMYTKRDPRMAWTLILPYTHYLGWASNKERDMEYIIPASGSGNENYGSVRVNNSWKIYLFRKFVPEGNMKGAINNRSHTPINFPLIRYADVLLMYAECLNETGKTAEAATYVNMVRERVGMPGVTATTKDEMFKAIKHEREVEMAAEGHSYMDYKRWGLLEELNGVAELNIVGGSLYKHATASRDYLFPIPNAEIDKNPALTQNPGW